MKTLNAKIKDWWLTDGYIIPTMAEAIAYIVIAIIAAGFILWYIGPPIWCGFGGTAITPYQCM